MNNVVREVQVEIVYTQEVGPRRDEVDVRRYKVTLPYGTPAAYKGAKTRLYNKLRREHPKARIVCVSDIDTVQQSGELTAKQILNAWNT